LEAQQSEWGEKQKHRMSYGPHQQLRLSQSLAMTPKLQQAIKLLQLTQRELMDFVTRELDENPLLLPAEDFSRAPALPGEEAGEQDWLGQLAGPAPALRDHLLQQLGQSNFSASERRLALHLIDALDDHGYLRLDLREMAEELGCEEAVLEALLLRLQQFEPTGVFARDLRECLALQLAERGRLDAAMERLLDHLPLVARGDWGALERRCRVGSGTLMDMVEELRSLSPRPASAFPGEDPTPVIPELLVLPDKETGSWKLLLNSEALPRVLVDREGCRRLLGRCRSSDERAYLTERLQAASWLERALERRATTLLRVGEALLRHQEGFFTSGVDALRPLTRRQLAEELQLHESTISRVTTGKYLASPRGLFELRYFFGTAVKGADGAVYASQSVRQKIRELIQSEAGERVMSDAAIVSELAREGLVIARRTVAKYRDAMKIPASAQRRRSYRLERMARLRTGG